MTSHDALRSAIVDAMRRLDAAGLNRGSSGNISARAGKGALITPTGVAAETLDPEQIVEIDLDGQVRGSGIPSSEWAFHVALLSERPEIEAVVHCHADACVALSCLRRPIPPFHYMIASFGGNDVRCADYAAFGSDDLANKVVEAMAGRNACLMANHGVVVAGRSLSHALALTEKIETLARQYILAGQAGTPVLLTDEEMAEVHRRYGHYGIRAMPR